MKYIVHVKSAVGLGRLCPHIDIRHFPGLMEFPRRSLTCPAGFHDVMGCGAQLNHSRFIFRPEACVSLAVRLPYSSACLGPLWRACMQPLRFKDLRRDRPSVPERGNYWSCWQVTNLRNRCRRRQDIRLPYRLRPAPRLPCSAQVVGRSVGCAADVIRLALLVYWTDVMSLVGGGITAKIRAKRTKTGAPRVRRSRGVMLPVRPSTVRPSVRVRQCLALCRVGLSARRRGLLDLALDSLAGPKSQSIIFPRQG